MSTHQAERLWSNACELIRHRLSEKDFTIWIIELEVRWFENGTLILAAPFGLFRDRIVQKYLSTIEACVSEAAKRPYKVVIEVGCLKNRRADSPPRRDTQRKFARDRSVADQSDLTQNQTFDTFLVGESNRLAYLAAQHLTERDRADSNALLLLHGGSGLGKTHLLRAIAHSLRNRSALVTYLRGANFVDRVALAVQEQNSETLHRELRRCDVLLIDGLQPLAKRVRAQQELCRLIAALVQKHKSVVLTSDRSPEEDAFTSDLRAQLARGTSVEIGALDHDLRLRMLKSRLSDVHIHLELHVLDRLVSQLQGSAREIDGLASRFRAAGTEGSASLSTAMSEYTTPHLPQRGPTSMDFIIDTVAWVFGLTRDELLSRDRSRRVALPRHIAAYFCRALTPASLPEIGVALGDRNHTSILRAVRSIEVMRSSEPSLDRKLQQVQALLEFAAAKDVA